jgi:hypothetical protein
VGRGVSVTPLPTVQKGQNMENYNELLAALKAEYEHKLAQKDAEVALLREQKNAEKEKKKEAVRKREEYLNEYISVKLFKDNDRYKDDVYVAVNGQNCIIKRGEWVKIKRKHAMVLDASEIQDMKTADFIEKEQSRFIRESAEK